MKVSVPFLKAFCTHRSPYRPAGSKLYCLHTARHSPIPVQDSDLPSSHHARTEHYGDLHLFWPSFNIKVSPLSGNSPLLCTHGGDSCTRGPCLLVQVFPSQPRESCWLEGNSSSVGGSTQLQGVRAAHAFAFVSVTQHHVSDQEITVSEQPEMGKTRWIQEELDPALLQLQSSLNTAPGSTFRGLIWQNRVARA